MNFLSHFWASWKGKKKKKNEILAENALSSAKVIQKFKFLKKTMYLLIKMKIN